MYAMLEQLKYINHLGEELDFGQDGIYVNENDLYDFTWNVVSVNEKISGFSRPTQTRYLPARIACASKADGISKRNKLFEIPEKDVLANVYGRLYANGYYCECFVTESKKARYNISERYMEATLGITTDRPYWIRENLVEIRKDDDWQFAPNTGIDFPFDFPFDLGVSVARTIDKRNEAFYESGFRMEIKGKAINPTVYINEHEYQVNISLAANKTLVIDSNAQKIYTVDQRGTQENVFDARGRDEYIFEPIPSGALAIRWDNSFDMDLYLLEERSEPKWRKNVS